ncbi:MAG: hypothetical protein ABEI27_04525 [Halobellus sp.]|uniref:hypothetical protein n=1 Tax=Halobellus sp. TaxID=1979212 RepID=UPI0035D44D7C
MTRFDADDPQDRRKLFADAIAAHRNRASAFLTIEADHEADADNEDSPAPWLQFAESTFNLDVDDGELDRLNDLVDDFPTFRVDQLESPEEAEGTNVRITARSDANRLATFADRVFLDVYDHEADYRAWVTEI